MAEVVEERHCGVGRGWCLCVDDDVEGPRERRGHEVGSMAYTNLSIAEIEWCFMLVLSRPDLESLCRGSVLLIHGRGCWKMTIGESRAHPERIEALSTYACPCWIVECRDENRSLIE